MMEHEQTDEIKALNQDLIMAPSLLQKNFNIPVHVTDNSTFDDSFSFLKARFQAEMDRVTEEMNKFSANVSRLYQAPNPKESQAGPRIKSASSRNSEPSVVHENKDQALPHGHKMKTKGMPAQVTWAAISESPLILQEGDTKKLKLQFDVSQFDPAEVKVQFLNDIIYVKAKHDERTERSLVLREYNQQFMLPKGVDPETVVTSLSRDGVLTLEVPLPPNILQMVQEGASYTKPNSQYIKNKAKESELEEASAPAPALNPPEESPIFPLVNPTVNTHENPLLNPPQNPLMNPPANPPANPSANPSTRASARASARQDKRST